MNLMTEPDAAWVNVMGAGLIGGCYVSDGKIILTPKENLAVGFGQDMTNESERKPRARKVEVTITAEMDAKYALDRSTATEWASWFRALGDPTRVLILHLLAVKDRPLTVGEITDALDVGQSTVSHHLAKLAEVRFVIVDHVATSSLWRVNTNCLECFPSAAEMVMGRVPDEFTEAMEGTT